MSRARTKPATGDALLPLTEQAAPPSITSSAAPLEDAAEVGSSLRQQVADLRYWLSQSEAFRLEYHEWKQRLFARATTLPTEAPLFAVLQSAPEGEKALERFARRVLGGPEGEWQREVDRWKQRARAAEQQLAATGQRADDSATADQGVATPVLAPQALAEKLAVARPLLLAELAAEQQFAQNCRGDALRHRSWAHQLAPLAPDASELERRLDATWREAMAEHLRAAEKKETEAALHDTRAAVLDALLCDEPMLHVDAQDVATVAPAYPQPGLRAPPAGYALISQAIAGLGRLSNRSEVGLESLAKTCLAHARAVRGWSDHSRWYRELAECLRDVVHANGALGARLRRVSVALAAQMEQDPSWLLSTAEEGSNCMHCDIPMLPSDAGRHREDCLLGARLALAGYPE